MKIHRWLAPVLLLTACGAEQQLAVSSPEPTVAVGEPPVPSTTTTTVALVAEVITPASRGVQHKVVLETTPPVDPVAYVNGLTYQHYNPDPAMEAYRVVAAWWGWPADKIEAWAPFVRDVMLGESAFCWNRRRGDVVESYSNCVITRQGRHEDVGFGQATRSLYGNNAQLCQQHGICSSQQILASPWASMLWSVVVPMDLNGSQPWCYSSAARSYHECHLAPDR